jgi:hypothetical protein
LGFWGVSAIVRGAAGGGNAEREAAADGDVTVTMATPASVWRTDGRHVAAHSLTHTHLRPEVATLALGNRLVKVD